MLLGMDGHEDVPATGGSLNICTMAVGTRMPPPLTSRCARLRPTSGKSSSREDDLVCFNVPAGGWLDEHDIVCLGALGGSGMKGMSRVAWNAVSSAPCFSQKIHFSTSRVEICSLVSFPQDDRVVMVLSSITAEAS